MPLEIGKPEETIPWYRMVVIVAIVVAVVKIT